MRISRHCYDKPHRCPGWNGGGAHSAKVHHCESGHIQIDYNSKWYKWQFHRCDRCDVLALPIVVQELDWKWWRWRIEHWIMKFKDWRDDRREDS